MMPTIDPANHRELVSINVLSLVAGPNRPGAPAD